MKFYFSVLNMVGPHNWHGDNSFQLEKAKIVACDELSSRRIIKSQSEMSIQNGK